MSWVPILIPSLLVPTVGICRTAPDVEIQALRLILQKEEKGAEPGTHFLLYIYSNGGAIELIPNTLVKNTILVLRYLPGHPCIRVKYWLLPDGTSNISVLEKMLSKISIKDLGDFETGEIELDGEGYRSLFDPDFEDELFKVDDPPGSFVGQGVLTWYGLSKDQKSTFGRGEFLGESLDAVMRPLMSGLLKRIWSDHHAASASRLRKD